MVARVGCFVNGVATVNADLNGAYNIIRKAFPQAFADVGDYPLHPVRVNLPRQVAYCHGS
jgi:hypothetical protein